MTSLSVSSPIRANELHPSSSSQPPLTSTSTTTTTTATATTDGTWELIVYISDLNLTKRLRVRGDLHVGGLMLKIVEGLENSRDWSDCVVWWPKKNSWLHRTRSTLDQYGVHAGAVLHFLSTQGDLFLQLPDLQVIQIKADFSADVFSVVVKICKDLGIRHPEELSLSSPLELEDLKKNRGISATRRSTLPSGRTDRSTRSSVPDGRRGSKDSLSSLSPFSRKNSSQSLFMPNADSNGSLFRFSLRRKNRLQNSLTRTSSTPISPPFYGGTLGRTSSTSTSTSVTSPGSMNSVFSGPGHDLCHSPWVSSREALPLLNRPKGLTEKARCNSGWLDSSRSLMEQGILPQSHLLLRFKFFTFFDLNPRLDAVRINQLYEQARWLILTEEVECTREEMVVFASLQLHILQLSRTNSQLDTASTTTTTTTRNDNDYDSCRTAEDLIDAALNDLQQTLEGTPISAALSSGPNRGSDATHSSNCVPSNRTSSDLFRVQSNFTPSSAPHHFSKGIFFDDPVASSNPAPKFTSNGTYSNIPVDRIERQRASAGSVARCGSSGDNDYDSLIIRRHNDYDDLAICSNLRSSEGASLRVRRTSPAQDDSVFCGSADGGFPLASIIQDSSQAPQLDGYLRFYKPKKFFLKSYKRQYFLFKDLTLSMFKSANDNLSHQLIWSLNLRGCEVTSDILVPASKFIIKLVIPSIRGIDEIWFKMDSEQQYINWLAGLKLACRGKTMADYTSFLDEVRTIRGMLVALRGDENERSNSGPSGIRRSVDDKENRRSTTLARGESKRRSFFGKMRSAKDRNSIDTNTEIATTLPEKPTQRNDSILRHKTNGASHEAGDSMDESLGSRVGSRFSSLISISKSVNSSSWKGSLNGGIQARDFLAPRFCRKSRLKRLMHKITEAQEKLKDMSSIEAKLSFIKAWQLLPDFGYTYFVIKLKGSKKEDYFALTPTKIVLLEGSSEEVLQQWRFQNLKSWSINWEVKEIMVQFEDEDLAFQCYTADCKVVHEFIGGYIFLSMRCLERNQKLNHELFHKLTGGWL